MPDDLQYVNARQDLTGSTLLSFSWRSPKVAGLALFCLFWDGFLYVWYRILFLQPPSSDRVSLLWFPIGHVIVGIVLTYVALAGLFNRTTVTLGPDAVRVRHGPLPWPARLSVPRHEISQLYAEEVSLGSMAFACRLSAVLRNGYKKTVVTTLPSLDAARELEAEMERLLGLTDKSVPGEADP